MVRRPDIRKFVDYAGSAFVMIGVLASVVFLVLPLVLVVCMAFDGRTYLGVFPPDSLSLQWFERFFSNEFILRGLRTSLFLAVATTVVSVTVGVTSALAVHRYSVPGKALLVSVFMSPIMIPAVVIGFAILLVFTLMEIRVGFLRLLAGHVIITLPFVIRAVLASLVGMRSSLVEAAMALGATERRAFFDITLPLARPGVIAGMIFAFALSIDEVSASLFLTDAETVTLPVALISLMRASFDLTIAAAAVLLVIVTFVLVIVLDRIFGIDRVVGTAIH